VLVALLGFARGTDCKWRRVMEQLAAGDSGGGCMLVLAPSWWRGQVGPCCGCGTVVVVLRLAGSLLRRCTSVVSSVSWLPQGRLLSSCSKLGLLRVKAFGDGALRCRPPHWGHH
jgi:hypothetical protein